MTLPADLYSMPTLAAWLAVNGTDPEPAYQCPLCPRTGPAEAFVATDGLPGGLPSFVCHVCASGPHREAMAAQEAADRVTAGPDWTDTRARRTALLSGCDWTQLPDAPLDEAQREAWGLYRTQLRTITDDFPTPDAVVWPEAPA